MPESTRKLIFRNALTRAASNQETGIVMPPAVTLSSAYTAYSNLDAAGHLALLTDGDQDLPVFHTGTPAAILMDFGADFVPTFICIINHNCFGGSGASRNKITIQSGATSGSMTDAGVIEYPDRSVDLWYPMRFNDAWYNSTAVAARWWKIVFSKLGGGGSCGEIVVAGYDPSQGADIDLVEIAANKEDFSLAPRLSALQLGCGESVLYDRLPPTIPINLDGVRLPAANNLLGEVYPTAQALRASPFKAVLVHENNRVCYFGTVSPNYNGRAFPDSSVEPRWSFTAELPRRSVRDELG